MAVRPPQHRQDPDLEAHTDAHIDGPRQPFFAANINNLDEIVNRLQHELGQISIRECLEPSVISGRAPRRPEEHSPSALPRHGTQAPNRSPQPFSHPPKASPPANQRHPHQQPSQQQHQQQQHQQQQQQHQQQQPAPAWLRQAYELPPSSVKAYTCNPELEESDNPQFQSRSAGAPTNQQPTTGILNGGGSGGGSGGSDLHHAGGDAGLDALHKRILELDSNNKKLQSRLELENELAQRSLNDPEQAVVREHAAQKLVSDRYNLPKHVQSNFEDGKLLGSLLAQVKDQDAALDKLAKMHDEARETLVQLNSAPAPERKITLAEYEDSLNERNRLGQQLHDNEVLVADLKVEHEHIASTLDRTAHDFAQREAALRKEYVSKVEQLQKQHDEVLKEYIRHQNVLKKKALQNATETREAILALAAAHDRHETDSRRQIEQTLQQKSSHAEHNREQIGKEFTQKVTFTTAEKQNALSSLKKQAKAEKQRLRAHVQACEDRRDQHLRASLEKLRTSRDARPPQMDLLKASRNSLAELDVNLEESARDLEQTGMDLDNPRSMCQRDRERILEERERIGSVREQAVLAQEATAATLNNQIARLFSTIRQAVAGGTAMREGKQGQLLDKLDNMQELQDRIQAERCGALTEVQRMQQDLHAARVEHTRELEAFLHQASQEKEALAEERKGLLAAHGLMTAKEQESARYLAEASAHLNTQFETIAKEQAFYQDQQQQLLRAHAAHIDSVRAFEEDKVAFKRDSERISSLGTRVNLKTKEGQYALDKLRCELDRLVKEKRSLATETETLDSELSEMRRQIGKLETSRDQSKRDLTDILQERAKLQRERSAVMNELDLQNARHNAALNANNNYNYYQSPYHSSTNDLVNIGGIGASRAHGFSAAAAPEAYPNSPVVLGRRRR